MEQRSVRVLRHHPVKLRLCAFAISRCVDAGNDTVAHHETACDHHVGHIAARSVQQQRLDGVDHLTHLGRVQPDHVQVRGASRGQPSQIGALQRLCTAKRGRVVVIGCANGCDVAPGDARRHYADRHILDHVRRMGVGAHADGHIQVPEPRKGLHHLAAARHHQRTVGQCRT